MARAFLLVMDSLGVGGAPDAEKFGDVGANTFGSICESFAGGVCEKSALKIPFLQQLGLGLAAKQASGTLPAGLDTAPHIVGQWCSASELSSGKDTISGHWEMAGVPVNFDWGYFKDKTDSFPEKLLGQLIAQGELPGVLGNCHASGTEIIARLGEEHIKTGKPIVYTSADSVMQIAAHEEHFGLERLLDLCEIARKLVDPYNIGRVIARPFDGDQPDNFARTANRHDYAVPPIAPTLLDQVVKNKGRVHAVGKVSDIFAAQGVSHKYPASGHEALMAATIDAANQAEDGDLVFTNFVDFDMLYGHRRNVCGYGRAIEEFDSMLQDFSKHLKDDDMVILTADHGNDPTWPGSDHTREQVPILIYGKSLKPGPLGPQTGFTYIAKRISDHLGLV
ncbi:MAG TPA: phosphopentomutase [Hellea balneolensis]|uniref:Phosphopentomutase n=1 Tax=Hellea balneolensis TaxID=287478 RepID=A0A7C5QSN2_9PROT|nr:phosphopentomutase [Hellea balneolensis]